jgi:hypothetical protein
MGYYIQPVVKRLGIKKRVTWSAPSGAPYTTLLHANGEDVKVVQELFATQLVTHHDGPLRASADARETGSTSESGGDGAVGETRAGGQNDGLAAPQNAPRVKLRISGNSFNLLASPTGFEPVLSP